MFPFIVDPFSEGSKIMFEGLSPLTCRLIWPCVPYILYGTMGIHNIETLA